MWLIKFACTCAGFLHDASKCMQSYSTELQISECAHVPRDVESVCANKVDHRAGHSRADEGNGVRKTAQAQMLLMRVRTAQRQWPISVSGDRATAGSRPSALAGRVQVPTREPNRCALSSVLLRARASRVHDEHLIVTSREVSIASVCTSSPSALLDRDKITASPARHCQAHAHTNGPALRCIHLGSALACHPSVVPQIERHDHVSVPTHQKLCHQRH